MSGRSFNQWQDLGAMATGQDPISGGPPVHIRDAMEAKRLAWRQTPGESFPDGYLGTVGGRRNDRVLEAVRRNNGRSYVRGVHRETRLDATDYLWPAEFNLMSGLVNQATTGARFVPPGIGQEQIVLINEGKPGGREVGSPTQVDPERASFHQGHLPPWS